LKAPGIAIEDIDYIEVIRGSNTSTYGSNAFLGAINIVTVDAVESSKLSLRTLTGSIDTQDFSGRYASSIEDFSYTMSFLAQSNSGFERLDEANNGPWPLHTRQDDLSTQQFRLQGLYTPTLSDEIDITLGFGKDRIQVPENDVRGYHNRQFDNSYQHVRWTHQLDNGDVALNFYHNRLTIEDDTVLGLLSDLTPLTPATVPVVFPGQVDEVLLGDIRDGLSERYHLELQHTFDVNPQLRLVWGSAFRVDRLGSRFLLGHDDIIQEEQYQLFGTAEWHFLPDWRANVSLMVEENAIVGTFASPRAGLNYQINSNHMLRTSITAGKRTPSLLSVFHNTEITFADGTLIDQIIGNTGSADEEKLNVLEVGYLGMFLEGNLTLDLKLFKEQLRDARYDAEAIGTDLDGERRVWRNGLDWDNRGAELQLKYQPDGQWLFSLQYAYIDIAGALPDATSPKDIGTHIPKHNASLLVAYRPFPGWELSGVVYHTSEMEWTGGDEVDEITRLDLRVAKALNFGNWRGKLEFLAHNVEDDYFDYDEDNRFEQRFFVRLKIEFE
jgi:iron complex outermembrane recepter protein